MIADIIVFATTIGPWVLGGVVLGGLCAAFIPKQVVKGKEESAQ